jgi:hypothetical protein
MILPCFTSLWTGNASDKCLYPHELKKITYATTAQFQPIHKYKTFQHYAYVSNAKKVIHISSPIHQFTYLPTLPICNMIQTGTQQRAY